MAFFLSGTYGTAPGLLCLLLLDSLLTMDNIHEFFCLSTSADTLLLSNLMYRFVATCFIKVIVSNTSNIIQKFQFVPFLNSYTSISSRNIIAKFMKK